MDDVQNIIVVGDGGYAKYHTTIQPVRFHEAMSMAITSISHGPKSNIHDKNNKIYIKRGRSKRDIVGDLGLDYRENEDGDRWADYSEKDRVTTGDVDVVIDDVVIETDYEIRNKYTQIEMDVGYYKSSLDVLRNIKSSIGVHYDDGELRLNTAKLNRSKIGVESFNLTIQNNDDSPWGMLGINQINIEAGDELTDIENKTFESKNSLAFLYVNIVENSYINGNLSRVLSVVPIQKTSDRIYHEFSHPNYVPIVVKEFSNILLELRDLNGNYLHFDPDFRTVITLKIRPINTINSDTAY